MFPMSFMLFLEIDDLSSFLYIEIELELDDKLRRSHWKIIEAQHKL